MRKTAEIGSNAIKETIKKSKNENIATEAKIFATLDYECRMREADYLAYPPVVAAGDNANIIHYTRYSKDPIDKKVRALILLIKVNWLISK